MNILLDHNVPHFVRGLLPEYLVSTAFDYGFEELVNGKLMKAAEEAGFEVMLTLDRNLHHQQNFNSTNLKVITLIPGGQKPRYFESLLEDLRTALGQGEHLPQVTEIFSPLYRGRR